MFVPDLIKNNKGPTTVIGVAAMVFSGLLWMVRHEFTTFAGDAAASRAQLFQLFADHSRATSEAASKQWEAQRKTADSVQNVAIALARIESMLRIPIEARASIPSPPKPSPPH